MRLTDKIAEALQDEIRRSDAKSHRGGKPLLHFEVFLAPMEQSPDSLPSPYGDYMLVIGFFWPTASPLNQSFYIRYPNPLEVLKQGVLREAIKAALAVQEAYLGSSTTKER
jgi:hypothetical protein